MRRFLNHEAGVAIVELALIAPFLILLTIGIIDIGVYARNGIEVGNAARAGAAYGAYNTTNANNTTGMVNAAIADAAEIKLVSTDVSAKWYCTCDATPATTVTSCSPVPPCASTDHLDSYATVTVSKQFGTLIAFPGLPSTQTLVRTATQRISP